MARVPKQSRRGTKRQVEQAVHRVLLRAKVWAIRMDDGGPATELQARARLLEAIQELHNARATKEPGAKRCHVKCNNGFGCLDEPEETDRPSEERRNARPVTVGDLVRHPCGHVGRVLSIGSHEAHVRLEPVQVNEPGEQYWKLSALTCVPAVAPSSGSDRSPLSDVKEAYRALHAEVTALREVARIAQKMVNEFHGGDVYRVRFAWDDDDIDALCGALEKTALGSGSEGGA